MKEKQLPKIASRLCRHDGSAYREGAGLNVQPERAKTVDLRVEKGQVLNVQPKRAKTVDLSIEKGRI